MTDSNVARRNSLESVCLRIGSALTILIVLSMPASSLAQSAPLQFPWMNRYLSPEQRATLLVEKMTLDEKIIMLHGVSPRPVNGYVGYVSPIPCLGIPALTLADGRAGRSGSLLRRPGRAAEKWTTHKRDSAHRFAHLRCFVYSVPVDCHCLELSDRFGLEASAGIPAGRNIIYFEQHV